LAWAALVDEERSLRTEADVKVDDRLVALYMDAAGIRQELVLARARLDAAEKRFIDLEHRTIERTDALVSEVLHRTEVRAARLATETSRLADHVAQIEHERTAILRHLTASSTNDWELPSRTDEAPAATVPSSWYAIFEAVERGSRDDVMRSFRRYVPLFGEQGPVADLGCGQGEFLQLADAFGLPAYGVDASQAAVEACRSFGLRVELADLFDHLAGVDSDSLGGAFLAQVVEHLHPEQLHSLCQLLERSLRPGGVVVIETPNPASFAVHVQSFWRDPTHIRPVPPQLLGFSARTAGLVVEQTIYSAPPPDEYRLAGLDLDPESAELRLVVKRFNESVDVLNELLFGPQNYALVLRKPNV
jgi:SAM-dependent methyltransferase